MQAFYFKSVRVFVTKLLVIDVPCVSDFCDCLQMYSSGHIKERCSCFSVSRNIGTLCLLADFEVQVPGGDPIQVKDYTSRKFTNMWLRDGIPPGVTAAMVNSDEMFVETWKDNIELGMISVSNTFDRCEVLGWAKRGFQVDQGATQPPPGLKNAQQTTAPSGKLKYHMTFLKFNKNANGEEPDLDQYKVSLATMTAIAVPDPPVGDEED